MATNQMRREAAKRKLERQQARREELARRRRRNAVITSAGVVVVVLVAVVLLATLGGPGGDPAETTDTADGAAPPTEQAAAAVTPESIPTEIVPLPSRPEPFPATVSCEYPEGGAAAKEATPPPTADVSAEGTVAVTLRTGQGEVPLTLDRALAPCTVNSFVSLAEQGYFDGTPCHRLTTSPGLQVLQCGDPSGTGSGGPGYSFADETFPGLTYGRGVLAMANAGPDTNGSQFFMVYGDAQLPPDYTVFGSIDPAGLEVIDTIARAGHDGAYDAQAGGGVPVEPVTIESADVS
ncbi:MAG TPA: peptidylprolyl isomerase [Pseudonocardia sp.]|nr:peptidylprolyl isomerase [Pseudonocardia sp.]